MNRPYHTRRVPDRIGLGADRRYGKGGRACDPEAGGFRIDVGEH